MEKKKIASILIFIIGLATLAVGVTFLVISLNKGAGIQDGEYLVSAENWRLESEADCSESDDCESSVIWDFVEIGKGKLTTNNHVNDYDFIWAIEDGKLKIETNWLYELENEYEYNLDQGGGILTLIDGDKEIKFKANFATE